MTARPHNLRLPLAGLGGLPLAGPAARAAREPRAEHREAAEAAESTKPAESSPSLLQVGDLARETGKTVRALHLYEELELLRPLTRSKGRYRLYGPDALLRIRWIGKLQEMGFSLTDIQTVLREWEGPGTAPSAMVKMREVYRNKLEETRAHQRRLATLEHELSQSLDYLNACEVCDPQRLLAACGACDRHGCHEHVPELVSGFRANRPERSEQ